MKAHHDPNLKGNVAELKIAAELARLGCGVMRPMTEHGRYDLVVDVDGRFVRIQCKSAPVRDEIVSIPHGVNASRRKRICAPAVYSR